MNIFRRLYLKWEFRMRGQDLPTPMRYTNFQIAQELETHWKNPTPASTARALMLLAELNRRQNRLPTLLALLFSAAAVFVSLLK